MIAVLVYGRPAPFLCERAIKQEQSKSLGKGGAELGNVISKVVQEMTSETL